MNPASLDRLHDIVTPPPTPWWPPAPGWYWLLGFASVIAFVLLLQGIILWQRNRYRREALAEWKRQDMRLREPNTRASALAEMSVLLKRVALTAFPRREVAQLTGPAWLAFLDRATGTTAYSNAEGAALEGAAYDPRSAADVDDVRAQKISKLVHDWIACHHPPPHRPRPSSSNSPGNDRGGEGTGTRDGDEGRKTREKISC